MKSLRSERVLFVALALLALSLPLTRAALAGNEIWQDKAYLPGMAGIAMGVCGAMIAAHVGNRREPTTQTLRLLTGVGTVGTVAVLCFSGKLWSTLGYSLGLILTLSTLSLVLAMHWNARKAQRAGSEPRPRFATAWLCACGRLSYEIYLTHMFVVLLAVRVFDASGGNSRWGMVWYVPIIGFSWLFGAAVARWLAAPCERALLRRLLKH